MAEATTPKSRRPRGEGSIYRSKKDGRWHGAVVVSDPDSGARRRHVVSGRTMAIVKDRMAELRKQLEATGRPTTRTSLAEFLAGWLPVEEHRVRTSTYRGVEYHVRLYISPILGSIALADMRPTDVERMTATIVARGRSGSSARAVRTSLRRALNDAMRDGLISRNVASLSRPPRVERVELHVLAGEELRKLLDRTVDDEHGPIFAIAAATGLRLGELLGLAWADLVGLDGPSPTLTVRRSLARVGEGFALAEPKTSRSRRTIELGPTVVRALRRQRVRQAEVRLAAGDLWQNDDDLVFTDPLGRAESGGHVSKAFSAALARLGLPHVRFHDLRHGVASMLLAQGVPLKLVSEQLGHSTIAITADTYSHLDREQRRASADAIERAIGGER